MVICASAARPRGTVNRQNPSGGEPSLAGAAAWAEQRLALAPAAALDAAEPQPHQARGRQVRQRPERREQRGAPGGRGRGEARELQDRAADPVHQDRRAHDAVAAGGAEQRVQHGRERQRDREEPELGRHLRGPRPGLAELTAD